MLYYIKLTSFKLILPNEVNFFGKGIPNRSNFIIKMNPETQGDGKSSTSDASDVTYRSNTSVFFPPKNPPPSSSYKHSKSNELSRIWSNWTKDRRSTEHSQHKSPSFKQRQLDQTRRRDIEQLNRLPYIENDDDVYDNYFLNKSSSFDFGRIPHPHDDSVKVPEEEEEEEVEEATGSERPHRLKRIRSDTTLYYSEKDDQRDILSDHESNEKNVKKSDDKKYETCSGQGLKGRTVRRQDIHSRPRQQLNTKDEDESEIRIRINDAPEKEISDAPPFKAEDNPGRDRKDDPLPPKKNLQTLHSVPRYDRKLLKFNRGWTDMHENMLRRWKLQVFINFQLQKKSYIFFRRIYNLVTYPSLVLTIISSVIINLLDSFGMRISVTAMNIIASFLTAVLRQIGPAERAQMHSAAVSQYITLLHSIESCMSVPFYMRPESKIFFEKVRNDMMKLISKQKDPPDYVIRKYEQKVGNIDGIMYGRDVIELMVNDLFTQAMVDKMQEDTVAKMMQNNVKDEVQRILERTVG